MKNHILAIVAHQDDDEILCAGTLAIFHQNGWNIHLATMTAGDCGSKELQREQISEIRKIDHEFVPTLAPEKREAYYQGWKKAVKRTLGWLKD